MSSLARPIAYASLLLSVLLTGCATTTIETSGEMPKQPLCKRGDPALPLALYWLPQWRPDQKEPAVREALAQRGIERFVSEHPCLSITELKRLPTALGVAADRELVQMGQATSPKSERVVLVVVRELGPRLLIGVPGLVEGGTEVVIEVRVLNPATSWPLASSRLQWRNGGTFVIKGISSLDVDMSAALSAALMAERAAP